MEKGGGLDSKIDTLSCHLGRQILCPCHVQICCLKKTLKENQLLDRAESGMPLPHKQPKRIAERGARKVHGRASGDKSQITIVACANAAGYTLPPMVTFKGER